MRFSICQVEENRTAAISRAFGEVVIHDNDNVIKMVPAQQFFMGTPKRQFDRAIVVGIQRIIAPTRTGLDWPHWQQAGGVTNTFPAVITEQEPETA